MKWLRRGRDLLLVSALALATASDGFGYQDAGWMQWPEKSRLENRVRMRWRFRLRSEVVVRVDRQKPRWCTSRRAFGYCPRRKRRVFRPSRPIESQRKPWPESSLKQTEGI